MKRRIAQVAVVVIILVCLVAAPVLAYTYYVNIQTHETGGNSYTYLPYIADIDNDYLADNYFISASGLDTKILQGITELQHLIVDDKLLFVIPILNANSTSNFKYTLGDVPISDFPIIVGYDGEVGIADSDNIELSNIFKIETSLYLDTSAGSDKYIVFKDLAFRIYNPSAGVINASIYYTGGWTARVVQASGVSSGLHTIVVLADGTNFKLYIDDELKQSIALTGASVPNENTPWHLFQNNVAPYVEYFKLYRP